MTVEEAPEDSRRSSRRTTSRRTAITHLLGAGVSIATVQKMAGHASINTTARCDRSDEDAKRKAAEMIHVSW